MSSRYFCAACASRGWEQTKAKRLGLPPVPVKACPECLAARHAARAGEPAPDRAALIEAVRSGAQDPRVLKAVERRRLGEQLLAAGVSVNRIRRRLQVSESAVWRWKRELRVLDGVGPVEPGRARPGPR